ncbi:MAG TPA: hypothetical protein VFI47_25580 [Acidimicrobiales bacterium]|nr:hypothetical protein [Acidimicrobiales bacterium]
MATAGAGTPVPDDGSALGAGVGVVPDPAVGPAVVVGAAVALGDVEALGDGDADAVAADVVDAVGVGSASALADGPATSAAATSRVPTSRNGATRVVVDIGAFLERFVTYGPNHRGDPALGLRPAFLDG